VILAEEDAGNDGDRENARANLVIRPSRESNRGHIPTKSVRNRLNDKWPNPVLNVRRVHTVLHRRIVAENVVLC
jgi:hypothetical protein